MHSATRFFENAQGSLTVDIAAAATYAVLPLHPS